MQRKVLCVAVIAAAVCFAAMGVSANVVESEDEGVVAAERVKHDACGAKGGHCEAADGCGALTELKGLCEENGSGVSAVCCVPKKKVLRTKGQLSPKQLAAKRKAALALRKKRAAKAAAAAAAMNAEGKKAKADAKFAPSKKPVAPGSAGDGKSVNQPMTDVTTEQTAAAAKAAAKQAKDEKAKSASAPKPPAAGAKGKSKKGKKRAAKKAKGKKTAKKTKAAVNLKLGMKAAKGSRGVDVAQKTNAKQWKCLKTAGWDWAVVRAFRSSNKPDPHVARSLKHARKAGYGKRKLGVYMYPCAKCGDAKGQVNRMIKHLRNKGVANHFSTIWLDIEGSQWPAPKKGKGKKHHHHRRQQQQQREEKSAVAIAAEAALKSRQADAAPPVGAAQPQPPASGASGQHTHALGGKRHRKHKKAKSPSPHAKARRFFRELVRACNGLKKYRCGVYTSSKAWSAIMGKRAIVLAKSMPLWYPSYAPTPSAETDEFEAFGGWEKSWAKQYSENQSVCGVSVDVNVRA